MYDFFFFFAGRWFCITVLSHLADFCSNILNLISPPARLLASPDEETVQAL